MEGGKEEEERMKRRKQNGRKCQLLLHHCLQDPQIASKPPLVSFNAPGMKLRLQKRSEETLSTDFAADTGMNVHTRSWAVSPNLAEPLKAPASSSSPRDSSACLHWVALMCGQWDKVQNVLITDPGISKHSMDDGFYYFSLFLPLVIFYRIQLLKL